MLGALGLLLMAQPVSASTPALNVSPIAYCSVQNGNGWTAYGIKPPHPSCDVDGIQRFAWDTFDEVLPQPPGTTSYGIEITKGPPLIAHGTAADARRVFASPTQQLPDGTIVLNAEGDYHLTSAQAGLTPGVIYYARVIAWTNWDVNRGAFVTPFFLGGGFGNAVPFVAPSLAGTGSLP